MMELLEVLALVLFIVRLVIASFLGLFFIAAFIPTGSTTTAPIEPNGIVPVIVTITRPRRQVILWTMTLLAFSWFGEGGIVVFRAVTEKIWEPSLDEWKGLEAVVGAGTLIWLVSAIVVSIQVNGYFRWWPKALALTSFFGNLALGALMIVRLVKLPAPVLPFTLILHFAFISLRLLLSILLLWALYHPIVSFEPYAATPGPSASDTSTTALLPKSVPTNYGTFANGNGTEGSSSALITAQTPGPTRPTTPNDNGAAKKPADDSPPSYSALFSRLWKLAPYLYPKRSPKLQVASIMCILIVTAGRGVNLMLPISLGHIIDGLTWSKSDTALWFFIYIGLRFCASNGGVFAVAQNMLWTPVMQFSDRAMSQMCFDHLLNLSLAFHTKKKTGEVLRTLDRGSSLNNLFQTLLFNILPLFADIIVATTYFFVMFGWDLALIVSLVIISYVFVSVVMTRWRTKLRRDMIEKDMVTRSIQTDVLMNWETVKYFSAEEHESGRYKTAIAEYQRYEFKIVGSLNLLNMTQNFIITLGLLAGSGLVALRVVDGKASPADFVVFLTYLGQLYAPLNSLGMMYRQLNTTITDSEKLLKLLNEPLDINDKPNAPDLVLSKGEIIFDDVHFSYDGKVEALKGVSFKIPPGKSVALVGESGSGKSTVLRLLYRFYEIQSGSISIDGQNIADVTQASLRKKLGVVPQDAVLFNESVKYNIAYGKIGATDEEIEEASKAAQFHAKVLGFPDGYNTKVGERGVRLSGGEKQRVSLARTMLKSPPILLLDESTSALDTTTEREVQKALSNLLKNRSSLSIAHRLSTIINSDIILVLADGKIVESGTHEELITIEGGLFKAMWEKQIKSEAETMAAAGISEAEIKDHIGSLSPKLAAASGYVVPPAPLDDVTESETTFPADAEPTTATEPIDAIHEESEPEEESSTTHPEVKNAPAAVSPVEVGGPTPAALATSEALISASERPLTSTPASIITEPAPASSNGLVTAATAAGVAFPSSADEVEATPSIRSSKTGGASLPESPAETSRTGTPVGASGEDSPSKEKRPSFRQRMSSIGGAAKKESEKISRRVSLLSRKSGDGLSSNRNSWAGPPSEESSPKK